MQKYCDRSWTRLLPGTYILDGRNITLDGKDANEPLDLTSPADKTLDIALSARPLTSMGLFAGQIDNRRGTDCADTAIMRLSVLSVLEDSQLVKAVRLRR
jgi:hypothetical protein